MNRMAVTALGALVIAAAMLVGSTVASEAGLEAVRGESTITADQLPPPVQKGLQAEVGEDDLVAITRTTDKGEAYVIEWKVDTITIRTAFSDAGAVLWRTVDLPDEERVAVECAVEPHAIGRQRGRHVGEGKVQIAQVFAAIGVGELVFVKVNHRG